MVEAEFTLFLRMRTKHIAMSPKKNIPIEELFPYYRKWTSLERMAGSDFLAQAPKSMFLRMRSEHMHKTRLYCCQIATILSPSYKKSLSLNTMVTAVFRPEPK